MNILYIDHYAGSLSLGMEFRPFYLAREWQKLGHNVRIIGADFSHLRKANPIVKKNFEIQKIDGIEFQWIKTRKYHGNGISRAITMFQFCSKLWIHAQRLAQEFKPDVVISSSTYPIDSIPAHIIAKKIKNARHIHEVHDMWPSTLIELGGMSKANPFVMLMQLGENYAYKHADDVVSLAQYAEGYMKTHGLLDGRFHYIPNGIVKEEWDNPEPLPNEHEDLLKKLKNENKFIVGYFGGHALSNCLMSLVEAAKNIQDKEEYKNVHFVLVGDGVEKQNLIRYSENNHINNISFLPPISKKAIPTLVNNFDCTYIGGKDSPLYRFGVCMNKIFDGMMAGKPIIFAINSPRTPVDEYECGIMVRPEEPEQIICAISELLNMQPLERDNIGEKGRRAVLKHFTYERLALEFADLFI